MIRVDTQFCPDYSLFYFGPRAHLWRVSNLGLELCLFVSFIYFIESLSRFELVTYFVFISYLIVFVVKCHVCVHFVSCRVFRIYSCQISYLFNYVSWLIVLLVLFMSSKVGCVSFFFIYFVFLFCMFNVVIVSCLNLFFYYYRIFINCVYYYFLILSFVGPKAQAYFGPNPAQFGSH